MKRKKTNWARVPWTPFERCVIPDDAINALDPPAAILRNSRYQVAVYKRAPVEPFGETVHLSFKVHDKQAWHDWRDMQRLKNEIVGDECDAIEIYPAESKLVDSANQYHLIVFLDYKLPLGFQTRLVGDGNWQQSKQRPWAPHERPADAMTHDQFQAAVDSLVAKKQETP